MSLAHKGQILPIVNQMIPIDKTTVFHANYDYDLNGFNQGEVVNPIGSIDALDFDGVGSYIDCGSSSTLATTDALTISVWAYSNGALSGGIVTKGQGGGWAGNEYGLRMTNADTICFFIADANNTTVNQLNYIMPKNRWVHILCVTSIALGKLQIYVNGKLNNEMNRTVTITNKNLPLIIGQGYSSTFWKGRISHLAVFNKAIPSYQIESIYNNGVNKYEEGLVGYWSLNEKEGPLSHDYSGSDNNGIWNGNITNTYGPTVVSIQKDEGKFKGAVLVEPETTNLLYDNGVFNGAFNTLTLTPTVTTIIPNYKYKIVTNAGTGNTIRLLIPLSKLIDGTGYSLSYKYNIIRGNNFEMADWGDSVIISRVNKDYKSYKFSSAYASRTIYDSSYRFMDFNISPDTEIEIWDIQLEARDYPTSFTMGTRETGRLWYSKEIINPSSFTISCWFNIPYMHRRTATNTGIGGSWHHPIIELATGENGAVGFSLLAGPEPASYNRNLRIQSPVTSTSTFAIQDEIWYHLVVTYDGTTYKIYIDGNLKISVAGPPINLTGNKHLMIGGGYHGKPLIKIDELRIEARAIPEEEVLAWAVGGLHYNYLDYSQYVD